MQSLKKCIVKKFMKHKKNYKFVILIASIILVLTFESYSLLQTILKYSMSNFHSAVFNS